MFQKNCPKCNNIISFKSKSSLKRSIRRNAICVKCRSNQVGDLKICSICKTPKNKNEYYKNYNSRCKKCVSQYNKKHCSKYKDRKAKYQKKYIIDNKNTIAEKQKEHYIGNKEKLKKYRVEKYWADVEKARAYDREYAKNNKKSRSLSAKKSIAKNPEGVRRRSLKWRTAHKEQMKQIRKKWADNNPLKIKEMSRKRRAKKLQVQEDFTAEQELITRKAFNSQCFNCKSTDNLHIDHHRPLSKGNALTLQNAVVLCQPCNSSKGPKSPEDFYGEKKCEILDKKLKKISALYPK